MNEKEVNELRFCHSYLIRLLDRMNELPEEQSKKILEECSLCHFIENNMEEQLTQFIGDIDALLDFLKSQWGWLITYDRESGRITADEGKSQCICPIVTLSANGEASPNLCHCSEGFAKRMFSMVVGREVRTKIKTSILRGDDSCVYEIQL